MKRASYKHGIEIIALNDNAGEMDQDVIAGQISVGLLADLFGVTTARVACDVIAYRKREPIYPFGRRRVEAVFRTANLHDPDPDGETPIVLPCGSCKARGIVTEVTIPPGGWLPEEILCGNCAVDIAAQEAAMQGPTDDEDQP